LTLASARALTNAGFLAVEDLQSVTSLELAMIPRIGAKTLSLLHELKAEKVPDLARLYAKAKRLRSILNSGIGEPPAGNGAPEPVRVGSKVIGKR
jgi:hypothetical protein